MPMSANTSKLYYYRVFKASLDELEATVTQLAKEDPKRYKLHPTTIFLASVYRLVTHRVPGNPDDSDFELGKSGLNGSNWRCAKTGTNDGGRIFFRFASKTRNVVIYIWISEQAKSNIKTLKTNLYDSFRLSLARGHVPISMLALEKIHS